MSGAGPHVVVVGAGIAGLSAAIRIAEAGARCDLLSLDAARRSHSVTARDGIDAASAASRFEETVGGGDFLANQALVKAMCEAAPGIVRVLDRMGVPFDRTPEGNLAGAATGQEVLYALDEQARRAEEAGRIRRHEGFECLSAVIDDGGACRGVVAMDIVSHEVRAFRADAVILATGGSGMVFGRSTASRASTGAAAAAVYRQGAVYANGEFIQVHPTAIPGEDKDRALPDAVRAAGGRVFTMRGGKPWYFLEERFPRHGNLVPHDVATREILRALAEAGAGAAGGRGEPAVHLDVTHLPPERLWRLRGALELYETFAGDDPRRVPMRVAPSVHASLGGLWTENLVGTERDLMTSVRGLYAAGECQYQLHGANRLAGNAVLGCIFTGMLAGPAAARFVQGLEPGGGASAAASGLFDRERRREEERFAEYRRRGGTENAYALHDELGAWMTRHAAAIRRNKDLEALDAKVQELAERLRRAPAPDPSDVRNDGLRFLGQLELMLELARVIAAGALRRDESRGAHWKPEFPDRDDARFLKTTLARRGPDGPRISYEDVDVRFLAPRGRRYG